MIIIKKYPNRRLYDTSKSQYINFDAIKTLVVENKDFQVLDSKSNQNLTQSILLHIISEHESKESQALMSPVVLKQLIRLYDSGQQGQMRKHLEQSVAAFVNQE